MFHYKFREIDKEILSKLNSDKKFDNYPMILKEMLAMRDYSRINKFLPYDLLDNAKEGAEYLFKAIKNKKKMCIIADYDVDGATSCAIMYSANTAVKCSIPAMSESFKGCGNLKKI